MKSFEELLNKSSFIEISKNAKKELIAKGYIYNKVFGWEKIDIINRFALDPNMTGIPCSLQAKWADNKKNIKVKDAVGNVISSQNDTWVRSNAEKAWYPTDNWFAYMIFKRKKNTENNVRLNNMDNIVAYGE